jgi:hypothetical protein
MGTFDLKYALPQRPGGPLLTRFSTLQGVWRKRGTLIKPSDFRGNFGIKIAPYRRKYGNKLSMGFFIARY